MTGRSHVEVDVLRANTAAYIHANPRTIVINRPTYVTDGAGGYIPGVSVAPHSVEVALDAIGDRQLPVRRTVDGIEIQPEFVILANYTADLKRGDWFTIDGIKYEIVFVHPDRSTEVRAEVAYRG